MKKKFIFAVIAVIIISGIAVTAFMIDGFNLNIHGQGRQSYDYVQGATIVKGKTYEPVYNEYTGDFRPKYNQFTEEQYDWYFGELPEFKQDFFTISKLIYEGKVTDYARLSENYWKQPEFYPAWFDVWDNTSYVNYNPTMWTPEGYGCYPSIKEITTSAKGKTITVNTYFRTGFGTHAYQGLIIRPYLPNEAVSIRGNHLFDQPKDADKYINVRITNPDDAIYESFKEKLIYNNVNDEDWFTILKPTHQIIYDEYGEKTSEKGFPDDWVRLLNIDIDLDKNIPNGDYIVAIKIDMPCFEINQEYYFAQDHEYYGSWYFPAGRYQLTGRPHFQIVMHVED
jgi:hypothetical protein